MEPTVFSIRSIEVVLNLKNHKSTGKKKLTTDPSLQFWETAVLYKLNKYILNSAGFLIIKVMLVHCRKYKKAPRRKEKC